MIPRLSCAIAMCAAACGGDAAPVPTGSGPTVAAPAPTRTDGSAPAMLLMTYNVNYGVAGDAQTIDLIARSGADVVMLQETNREWERALRPALEAIYPHMHFLHADRRAGGLGFLSRHPIVPGEPRRSPIGYFPAWRAVVDGPLGRVQLLNLHLRPPGSQDGSYVRGYFASQEPRLEETRAHLEVIDQAVPVILAGDFNEDARGKSLVHLAALGFDSVLDRLRPGHPTWRWETRHGLIKWQLDHILLGPGLTSSEAWVVEDGASDHMPVLARITRATGARGTPPAPAR